MAQSIHCLRVKYAVTLREEMGTATIFGPVHIGTPITGSLHQITIVTCESANVCRTFDWGPVSAQTQQPGKAKYCTSTMLCFQMWPPHLSLSFSACRH